MNSNDLDLKEFLIPEIDEGIFNSSFDVFMSKYVAQPQFNLGFHHFIHQSFENFLKILKEQGTKTFYWVVNGYEIFLNDQDKKTELIDNIKLYLNLDNNSVELLNNKFLELWEILMIYKLLNKSTKVNIITSKKDTKDRIELSLDSYFNKINKITNNKSSKLSYDNKSYDVSFILSTNYVDYVRESESIHFKEIITDTYKSLDLLNSDGSIVINIGDTFTTPTIKLIVLLKSLFNQVSIYKPYYSRPNSSQKYLVCIGFNRDKYDKISKKLEKCINLINKNKDDFVIDFMSDINIPAPIMNVMTYINILLSGIQHRESNKIIKYIKSENYFGQEYQEYIIRQSECTQYFLSTFFPVDKNDYDIVQKKFKETLTKNINIIKEFKNTKTIMT